MKIALLEPFYGGSHKRWADGLKAHSQHDIEILSLPARHWKWRMHGAAISLATQFHELSTPDLILATDMLDLATFLSLIRKLPNTPVALYFHENQLTYPWSPADPDVVLQRDNHYAWINYTSALAADKVFFNSSYHRDSFLSAIPKFLKQFPDHNSPHTLGVLEKKSAVLPLGMNLPAPADPRHAAGRKNILWNHRWEYDKNPELFFQLLFELSAAGVDFGLIVLGESYKQSPKIFELAKERLQQHIVHWGFVKTKAQYNELLLLADILPVTSNQDFFGGSVVEAIAAGVIPILPKRLAYPAHIPSALHSEFFYEQADQFLPLLKKYLSSEYPVASMNLTVEQVRKYDWSQVIQEYDKVFSAV